MGLKKHEYVVKDFDLKLPSVYARITNVYIGLEGNINAIFEIQQERKQIGEISALETIMFETIIDKSAPIHEQIYNAAKAPGGPFEGWEDDIVD